MWHPIEFIGLTGDSPHVETGIRLMIFLHKGKIAKRPAIIYEVILIGRIQRKPLGELTEGLVFTQTSVFGRFGRTLLKPLYTQPRAHP